MSVSKETLRAVTRDFNLIPLSEEELDLVLSDVNLNLTNLEKIRRLDLTGVPSARQIQAGKGARVK